MSGRTQRVVRRDTANGMVGGVAAGFARFLGVDVVWVRLTFAALTLLGGGFGVLLYLAAWLVIPEGDDRDAGGRTEAPGDGASGHRDPTRGPAFWIGVALISIGGLALIDGMDGPSATRITWVTPREVLLPIVLIGIGALILRSGRRADVSPEVPRAAPRTPDGGAFEERIERWSEEVGQRAEAFEARSATLREARSRSRVAPVTLGLALVTLGGVWLLGSVGVTGLTLLRALAGALLVVGAGLVVGASRGRGRGLIAAGLVLAPVVLVTANWQATVGTSIDWSEDVAASGVGTVNERPTTLDELPRVFATGLGETVIDLRSPDLVAGFASAGTTELMIVHGFGELTVYVPETVTVEIAVTLGVGEIALLDAGSEGIGRSAAVTVPGTSPDGGRLLLTIEQGLGVVTVSR